MIARVLVAMSGGVDSSVAALLLKKEGFDVIGATMRLWDAGKRKGDGFGKCSEARDPSGAGTVARTLGIPHHVFHLEKEFEREVVSRFVSEYLKGRTPSPCVLCNQKMKFDILLSNAKKLGASFIATGHYARITKEGEPFRLLRGKDPKKDQSYFLFGLDQDQLSFTKFPLGGLTKEEVRKIAGSHDLAPARKGESQDICFVDGEGYRNFLASRLEEHAPEGEGEIRDTSGKVLGTHRGIHLYTVGQRRGIGIPARISYYVIKIDADTNSITVGPREQLKFSRMTVDGVKWIAGAPPSPEEEIGCQVRYRHAPARSSVIAKEGGSVEVLLKEPQYAVCPGQAAVFYRDEEVLGGGWIAEGTF